jgi:hypothetical protein
MVLILTTLVLWQPANPVPQGKWAVAFSNGVAEVCDFFPFDGPHVLVEEPRRRALGSVAVAGGSVLLTFQDDRVERWTPVGQRYVVEHLFPGSRMPQVAPVLGIAERRP